MGSKKRKKLLKQAAQKTQNKSSAANIMMRQILIGLGSLILVYFFFSIPFYRNWFLKTPKKYYEYIKPWSKDMDLESRKKRRYQGNYLVYDYIKRVTDSNSVFLIPPVPYLVENSFSKENQQTHLWAYPSLLYYHIDYIKTVDLGSTDEELQKATHTLTAANKQFYLYPFPNEVFKDSIINMYRQYELKTFYHPHQVSAYLKDLK